MPDGVYIFGGNISASTSDFLPKNNNKVWQAGPGIPNGFQSGCGVKISAEELVLIGGYDDSDRMLKYNIKTRTFAVWNTLKQGRFAHSCVLFKNNIFVVGGFDGHDYYVSTEIISLSDGMSRFGDNIRTPRVYAGLVSIGGRFKKVLSFGGYYTNEYGVDIRQGSIDEWNEDSEEWNLAPYSLNEKKSEFSYLAVPPSMVCN